MRACCVYVRVWDCPSGRTVIKSACATSHVLLEDKDEEKEEESEDDDA